VDKVDLEFGALSLSEAESIARWRYSGDWSVYDTPADQFESSAAYMADPRNGFFGVHQRGELIGFCSLGADGRVPGGSYDDSCVDCGAGMRPDLVGRGSGAAFLREAVSFLRSRSDGKPLRATIASWNERALRAAQQVGFEPRSTFTSPAGTEFTVLVLEGTE
jgi:[ribosomal protein S18]-alanine N-acetyltransferase